MSSGNLVSGNNTFATFTNSSGTLTINFTSANGTTPTTSLVNGVLQRINYQTTSDAPASSVTLAWTFSDGTASTSGATSTVSITGTNDALTISGVPSSISATEDIASNADFSAITLADVDGDNLTLTRVMVESGVQSS